ncbi:TIR domain-containing protein [Empedobacter brevis]
MKVFLSWSGNTSHQVALKLRDWLPSVIQVVEPYVSSEDIDKGARWSTDISRELEDSAFGILCVTKENINAPWLQFEAGALSKKLDKSFVSPFLFDIKRSEIKGPILQFQSTIIEESDILKLVKTINKACGEEQLKEERLVKAFEVWYPKLEEELSKIESPKVEEQAAKPVENRNTEILEEILELSRSNQRILTSPDSILPPDYLDYILNKSKNSERNIDLLKEQIMVSRDLDHEIMRLYEVVSIYKSEKKVVDEEFEHMILRIREINDYLQNFSRKIRRNKIL